MREKALNLRLRLPAELHRKLADSAGARGKSLNTEILERLRYTFSDPAYQPATEVDLEDVRRRLAIVERALFGHNQGEPDASE